jgi:hypothetical protein
MAKKPKAVKGRGVLVRLEPTLHRRLKYVAIDRDSTVLALVRGWIAEGVARAEATKAA